MLGKEGPQDASDSNHAVINIFLCRSCSKHAPSMSEAFCKALASTLVQHGAEEGLSDAQVSDFLSLIEHQVPQQLGDDPTKLGLLLELSKDLARKIDDCEMPSHTVTVTKDFKFSPPSIKSEVPCHLHFKLLPYTAAHHICVINASTQDVVASSGPLRAGDSFSTTLVEPGRYAFSSEAYPFMHGGLHAAACPSTSSNAAASRLEAEPSVDCIKANSSAGPELSPKTEGAAAASAAQLTGKPARRSASPSKGAAAGQASTAAGQHRQAHGDHDTLVGAGSDLATTTTATTAPALVGAAGAATADSSSADAGAQAAPALVPLTDRCRRSSCGSDSCDLLPQQPSERAVLELVAAGAQRQHSLPASGRGFPGVGAGSNASAAGVSILKQPQPQVEGSPTPSSCCNDIVPDHAEAPTAPTAAAAAGRTSPAELFRSGPYRRRATAYDDDLDPPFHQAPTAELRAARAQLQQQQACSSQQDGSRSLTANSSSNSGGGAPAGRQAAGEQQRSSACSMVRYAAGFEGLQISCSAIALLEHSSAAALARAGSAGSSVLLGSCRSMQHNLLDSDAEPGTASAGFSDDEEVTEFLYEPLGTDTDEGGGCASGPAAVGYMLMRSDSSQHTRDEEPGSPADDSGREHQQQEQDWRPRQQEQLGSEHSQEDVISEAAHLLPSARCNGSGRRGRAAWPSSSTGPAADAVLRSHSESDEPSDSDSGRDVRLRHAHGRGAAGGSSTNSSWLLGASRQQGQQHQPNGRRVERLDPAAQTSPLYGGSLRMNQPPGSSWTLGGKQVTSFSSPAGHTAVEDISARQNSSSSSSNSRASVPAAGASAAAAAKRYLGSGSSTMLGPGTHRIGRGGQLPPIGNSLEAVTISVADTAAVLQKCSLQAAQLAAKLPGAVADSACDIDGEPPSLAARLAQKQQQQKLVAANALAGSAAHSRTSSSGGSSAAGSALAAAAAAGQGQETKKKKKGKAKADAAAVRAAAEVRAAVEARRHDRDTVECALLDNRGSSSRGDSEDEAATCPKGSAPLRPGAEPSTAAPAPALSKCKFKACKLTFASLLNQQRCQMSHLPSARTTTAKAHQAYKAEVVAFFKALPAAAVAKLLRLPEPAWLPARHLVARAQQKASTGGGKRSSAAAAGAGVEAAAEPPAAAVRLQLLQAQPLYESWADRAREVGSRHGDILGMRAAKLSRLAQLCCGVALDEAAARAAAEADDERLPLLAPPTQQQQQQQGPKGGSTAATAPPPAVEFAAKCGACCGMLSSSGVVERGEAALGGGSSSSSHGCSCRCHSEAQKLVPALPAADTLLELLEQASEGTLLCNPRLLQQPHPGSCCCHVCGGLAAGPHADRWSPEAVMAGIVSGQDVLDVLADHGVDDAALSYAVERRLITAFHQAKEADARQAMCQLLDEGSISSKPAGSAGAPGKQAPATAAALGAASQGGSAAAAAAGAAGVKKGQKDKRKATKASKAAAAAAPQKVPAWKADSNDSEGEDGSSGSSSSDEAVEVLISLSGRNANGRHAPPSAAAAAAKTAGKAGAATATGSHSRKAGAPAVKATADTSLQSRLAAEQLLQARLLQQDQELQLLQARKQQQQQQQQQQAAKSGTQATRTPALAKQQQQQQHQHQQQPQQAERRPSKQCQQQDLRVQQHQAPKQQEGTAKQQQQQHTATARGSSSSAQHTRVGAVASTAQQLPPQQHQQQRRQQPGKVQAHGAEQQRQQTALDTTMPSAAPATDNPAEQATMPSPTQSAAAAVPAPTQSAQATPAAAGAATSSVIAAPAAQTAVQEVAQQQQQQCAVQCYSTMQDASASCAGERPAATSRERDAGPAGEGYGFESRYGEEQGGHEGHAGWQEGEWAEQQQQQEEGEEVSWQQQQQQPVLLQPHQQVYYQQLQQQQAALLQEWPQQLSLPMHDSWLTGAHSRAAQDMLVVTGRAAAASDGRGVVPFTPPELQQIMIWTSWYYHHHLASMATMAAQQQQQQQELQQQQQQESSQQPPAAPAELVTVETAAASTGSTGQQQQQQQEEGEPGVQQAAAAGSCGSRPGSSGGLQEHQHEESKELQFELLFGTLPADLQSLEAAAATGASEQQCGTDPGPLPQPAAAAVAQQEQAADSSSFVHDVQAMLADSSAADGGGASHVRTAGGRQHQCAPFRPAEAAELLDARWQAVVDVCGPPLPSLQRAAQPSAHSPDMQAAAASAGDAGCSSSLQGAAEAGDATVTLAVHSRQGARRQQQQQQLLHHPHAEHSEQKAGHSDRGGRAAAAAAASGGRGAGQRSKGPGSRQHSSDGRRAVAPTTTAVWRARH